MDCPKARHLYFSMALERVEWAKVLWSQIITLWSHLVLSEYLDHFSVLCHGSFLRIMFLNAENKMHSVTKPIMLKCKLSKYVRV